MADYSRQRATAERLIKQSGKAVTLQRTTQGVRDPLTGETTDVITPIAGDGVFLNYSNTEIDGTAIKSSDRKMLYFGEAPEINDKYVNERVISVNPLNPDDSDAILYSCQMRV